MAPRPNVLIIDDDKDFVDDLQMFLEGKYECRNAHSGEQGLKLLDEHDYDLLLLDIDLGQGINGFDILRQLKASGSSLPVVMITKDDSPATVVQAMKLGAQNYVGKTPSRLDLEVSLEHALRESQLERENQIYRNEIQRLVGDWELIGESDIMVELKNKILKLAPTNHTVLITGESGTGKELVARDLHAKSTRKDKPLVTVNCGIMQPSLIESKLFGHEKGAFTGACQRKVGEFELAHQATIFLDEIGDLPFEAQSALLRVLENKEIQRIGGTVRKQVDVRVIAATNRNLQEFMRLGKFREDLYYRLSVTPIAVLALREHAADIPSLAKEFVARENREQGKSISRFSPEALQTLITYPWPGNVRQLSNVMKHAVTDAEGSVITVDNLPTEICIASGAEKKYEQAKEGAIRKFEREYWGTLFRLCEGNKTQMAKRADISRQGLDKIWKTHGLELYLEKTEARK